MKEGGGEERELLCVFITAVPITKMFARDGGEGYCVIISVVPIVCVVCLLLQYLLQSCLLCVFVCVYYCST